jgi:tripartite-type tricarboxylate transporter receptor subunit TctC
MKTSILVVTAAITAFHAAGAQSQTAGGFPARSVRIVVGFTAGGNNDLVARAIAQHLTEGLGQQVVVENRPSASGLVGSQFVAKAAPDGYTLLHVSNTFAMVPSVLSSAGYDPLKEFTGVTLTALSPKVLDVTPALPVRSVKELIALARARPGALSYASAGVGGTSHMAAELFNRQAGTRMLHVPYKGNSQAIVDVIGGQVMIMFDEISTSLSYIRSGRLRVLAVSSRKRSPLFPDVPTIDEAGLAGFEDITFNGLVAPAGTPRGILARVHAEVAKAVHAPDLRKRFLELGVELTASASPDEFTAYIKAEFDKKAKLARDAGIRLE